MFDRCNHVILYVGFLFTLEYLLLLIVLIVLVVSFRCATLVNAVVGAPP